MIRMIAVVLAAVGIVLLWQAVAGNPGGHTWTAEFTNARGLVAGNDVREQGAVVGRVTSISLATNGEALVRFQLSDKHAAPRTDATAAIEPADLLGDTYLSLSPGAAAAPLRGAIDPARTVNAPRLDQVLDALRPNVRDGMQALIVEAGLALDQRGGSLAQATVATRPALQAAQATLGELNAQNGSLARLIPVAQQAAAQLDSRRTELGPLLDGLAHTLDATAGSSGALSRGLASLPVTLGPVRSTSGGLSATATAATDLVRQLQPQTATLAAAVRDLPSLVDRVKAAAPAFVGALDAARTTLQAGTPSLSRLSTAFPTLRAQAPRISTLLSKLDAAPGIAQGFFVDFPDQAAESGKQLLDPFADSRRAYWRGAAVFSCEAFVVPVAPGCLTKAIANLLKQPPPPPLNSASKLLDFLVKR